MVTKNQLKFLRRPIHKIPCHKLNCKIILYTRSYRKKFCHIHGSMAKLSNQCRKNVKKSRILKKSPYSDYGKTVQKICLKCGNQFDSISKFNKLCNLCNHENKTIRQQISIINNSSLNMQNYYNSNIDYD